MKYSWEVCIFPRAFHNNSLCKIWGANRAHYGELENREWKKCYMKCGVWNQMKIWSLHLLDNLSNCPMNLEKLSHEPEKTGSSPVEFFRFMWQLLKLSSKCEDHIFIWWYYSITPFFNTHQALPLSSLHSRFHPTCCITLNDCSCLYLLFNCWYHYNDTYSITGITFKSSTSLMLKPSHIHVSSILAIFVLIQSKYNVLYSYLSNWEKQSPKS